VRGLQPILGLGENYISFLLLFCLLMRVGRALACSLALFSVGSLLDNLLTYELVVVLGLFREANPFVAPFVYGAPLWLWFVRDFAVFGLVVLASWSMSRLILRLSRFDPPPRRARNERIASCWWLVPLCVAALRLLPTIHNALIACGIPSPISALVGL